MTEPTIDKKVPNGVSKAVYNKVSDIAKEEGKKNKIDTKAEYNKLSEYLAGNSNEMNRAEKAFVQEQLKEYEDLAAKESKNEFMDKVTEAAKELVKRFAKGSGADDKKIDSVQEAEGLLKELDNPQNDFNAADVKYIQQVVKDSGVLPQFGIVGENTNAINATNAEPQNPAAAPAKPEANENKPVEKKESVEEKSADSDKKAPEAAPAKPEKPAAKPAKPKSKTKPNAPVKPRAPKAPENVEEPKYDENQKKLISDMNYRITRILEDRNQEYYRNIDIKIGKKLLKDAKALGLENTKEYKQLKALCDIDDAEKAEKPKSRRHR